MNRCSCGKEWGPSTLRTWTQWHSKHCVSTNEYAAWLEEWDAVGWAIASVAVTERNVAVLDRPADLWTGVRVIGPPGEEPEPDVPFEDTCEHLDDPKLCDVRCAECSHVCASHGGECHECDCLSFV